MKRGQGAFEYILLLAGVLLIVVLAIIILRGTIGKGGTQTDLNTCKAQLAGVSVCTNSTGGWASATYGVTDGCGAGCLMTDYGMNPACGAVFTGPPALPWYVDATNFKCGPRPA
ncbi:MAG TPA: class III signal peptide-containing protein [Candidatus Norongarragalinales archaeon]|nr:class III signal peptide-containing protein [Candidatus Norongarragalinales archaeon]